MLTSVQIQSICKEIQQDPHVIAILLTGSYVYGKPNDESDLDIRMIVNDAKYEIAHWDDIVRFDVRIEAFFNTIESIERYMEKAENREIPPNVLHFWANGKIVYDPKGVAKKLQRKARTMWKLGNFRQYG